MGASTSQYISFAEPLETRQLLTAAPISSGLGPVPALMPSPMPIAAGTIVVVPAVHFDGLARIVGSDDIGWNQFLPPPATASGMPLAANSMTVEVITASDIDSGDLPDSSNSFATAMGLQNSIAGAGEADRGGFQADPTILAPTTATSDGTDSSTLASSTQTSSATSATSTGTSRGTGGHAQPGLLHPGEVDNRGAGAGTDDQSSGGSPTNGSHAHLGDPAPGAASAIVTETHAPAGSDLSSPQSNQASVIPVASASDKAASGLANSGISGVGNLVRPFASATFSILPLAIAEISAAMASAQPTAIPQAFVQPAAKSPAAVVLDAVGAVITAPAVPARAALINLFHVDAVATFSDAMGVFIDESAARAASRQPLSHSRAWKITAGAAAADLLMVGYWLAARRREDPADRARGAAAGLRFSDAGLAPG